MTHPWVHYIILSAAAFLAGAINSVAGGGTLLTFPSLLAIGIGPVLANGTSTVALVPGSLSSFWGYRKVTGKSGNFWLWLGLPSLLGGLVGALLVVKAGDSILHRLIPWLLLGATVLFMVQDPIRKRMMARRAAGGAKHGIGHNIGVAVFQFIVAIYGGFFGAGIGILMLAALGFLGIEDINEMNGLKTFAGVCINGVASVTFIIAHKVDWNVAVFMAASAIIGGYIGALYAQKINPKAVRGIVVAVGLLIAVWFFAQELHVHV